MENIISSNIKVFETPDGLSRNAAVDLVNMLNEYIKKKGTCTIVLSGGNTPIKIYWYIAENFTEKVDWTKVYFFWGDERCVPPDDDDSNFKSANLNLLTKIGIPGRNIFRIKGELSPKQAADEYEEELKKFFLGQRLPSFDVVLLGIGSEGHTASLFPGSKAMKENNRWVIEDYIQKLKSWRITLTVHVLNNSRDIVFIAGGKNKSNIINKILKNRDPELPASMIKPTTGRVSFYLDKDAAPA